VSCSCLRHRVRNAMRVRSWHRASSYLILSTRPSYPSTKHSAPVPGPRAKRAVPGEAGPRPAPTSAKRAEHFRVHRKVAIPTRSRRTTFPKGDAQIRIEGSLTASPTIRTGHVC
jgi:hypothetical protein